MAFLLFATMLMDAQAEEKKTKLFVEIAPIVINGECLNIQFGAMHKANDILSFGGGIGITEPFKFNVAPNIPIFVRAQAEAKMEGVTPYFSFDAGYGLNTDMIEYGSIIINPMVGVKFGNAYVGVGYYGSALTKGGGMGSSMNIRLGYQFNNGINKSAVKNFFSKTYFSAEIGGGIGLSNKGVKVRDNNGDTNLEDIRFGNNISAQISWMYKIRPNWSAGIGIGVNTYLHRDEFSVEYGKDEIEWLPSIPLYLRGQYTFKEDGSKIRPYIACDFGALINQWFDDAHFIVEPQIGVKFNDKYRVALGFATCNGGILDDGWDLGEEHRRSSSLNLKLGLDF